MGGLLELIILVAIIAWGVNVSRRLNKLDGKTFLRGALAKDKKEKK